MSSAVATAPAWRELVSVALVGTERKPPPAHVAEIGALVGAELDGQGVEVQLLTAAGVLAAFSRAGLTVVRGEGSGPDAAPPDTRPDAPKPAVQVLELVLGGHVVVVGGPVALAAFWLDRCAATGHKVPARLLPALLDLATREGSLRDPLATAGGPLAAWLAARNEQWSWAAGDRRGLSPAQVRGTWQTGDQASRLTQLRRLRTTDPATARDLVMETWSGEKADDRVKIVEAMAISLGDEDEPFLEAVLDDRAKAVRLAAAGLLAALPSSRLAARMVDRVRPLVSYSGRGRKRFDVQLPDEPDRAARRDGIVDDGAPPGTGRRSWWLIQLIAATPLHFWSEEFGLRPAQLIELASQAELEHGWSMAATRQRHAEWIVVLLRPPSESHARPGRPGREPALLAALPAEEARAVLEPVLRSCADSAVGPILAAVPGPWSLPLTTVVLDRIRGAKSKKVLPQILPALAASADPAIGADLEQWLAARADNDQLRRQVRQVAHTLSIRQTIIEAFA